MSDSSGPPPSGHEHDPDGTASSGSAAPPPGAQDPDSPEPDRPPGAEDPQAPEPGPPPPPPEALSGGGGIGAGVGAGATPMPPPPPPPAGTSPVPPPAPGRPRWGLIVPVLVLLLLLPLGAAGVLLGSFDLSVISSSEPEPAPESEAPVPDDPGPRDGAPEPDGPEPDDGAPEGGVGSGPGEVPDPSAMPDPGQLSGRDAAMAELLTQVAASEEPMRTWQRRQQEALLEAPPDAGAQEILGRLQAAGEDAASALAEARGPLEAPVDDEGVDAVREAYLAHHDAWADYLEAVADDPAVVAENAETQRWSQPINTTAEGFAEALEAELDDELHPEVRAYAEQLLADGFEPPETVPDV